MNKQKIFFYVFQTSQRSSIYNIAINKVQIFDTVHSEFLRSSLNKLQKSANLRHYVQETKALQQAQDHLRQKVRG